MLCELLIWFCSFFFFSSSNHKAVAGERGPRYHYLANFCVYLRLWFRSWM